MKKRVVYHPKSSVHDSVVNTKVVVIIVIGLLLIGGLTGLLWYSGEGVTGKAWEITISPKSGDVNTITNAKFIYKSQQPTDSKCKEQGAVFSDKPVGYKYDLSSKQFKVDFQSSDSYCCPDDSCGYSKDYCISEKSLIKISDDYNLQCVSYNSESVIFKCLKVDEFIYLDSLCLKSVWNICDAVQKGKVNDLYHCDGSQWTKCDAKTKGTTKESADEGKEYFCDGKAWVVKDKCSEKTKGSFVISADDQDYVCDGKKWQQLDKCDAKAVGVKQKDVPPSVVCDQSVVGKEGWKKCVNGFCPLSKDLGDLVGKDVATIFEVSKLSGVVKVSADIVADAKDLQNKENISYSSLSETEKKVYFKYKESVYVVQIKEKSEDPTLGKVVLEVKSLKDVNLPNALATINLALDANNPLKFPPKTLGVDVEGDKTPDVYVTATGFFDVKGDAVVGYSLDKAKVLVLVSPYVDVVSGTGKMILASDNGQEFAFNGKHPIVLTGSGENQVLYIDGKSNYIAKEYLSKDGVHYTSKDKTQFINFKVLGQSGLFAVVQLSTAEAGGGGLKQVYEDTLVADKELFFGMGTVGQNTKAEPSLSICPDDPPKEVQGMSICYKNAKGEEVKDNIKAGGVKPLGTSVPYVLWYMAPVGEADKMARAFSVFDLDVKKDSKFTPAVVDESSLSFTNNLASGRRVALHVEVDGKDNYYLLSHPEAKYFDFQQLNLTDISDAKRPMYKSEGDKSEVVFNLPLKKQVNVKLKFGDPSIGKSSLTYELSSKTQVKTEVTLLNELQASVSTYGSTPFKDDDLLKSLGTMAVSENDISLLKDTMMIKYGAQSTDVELSYRKPKEINGNALLYYHTFTSGGLNAFTKYADVYLFYDLTDNKKTYTHAFDDVTFILPIV